jgi:leader peptidase (prepilin peptidase)/N-methyltransferase
MEGLKLLHEFGLSYVFAFIGGACMGSFLNVVIHRWPLGESIVKPGSHCPSCGTSIPWYWNLPLISWVILRGKCRWCKAPISARYLVVEFMGGAWAVLSLLRFGPSIAALACFVFGAALIAGSAIDLYHRLLPDTITLGLVPLGIGMSLLPKSWTPGWEVEWYESLIGLGSGAGLFLFVLLVFKLLTGKEGMGMGDVKLMAGVGAVLGYMSLPMVILIGGLGGVLAWLVLYIMGAANRDFQVPFGPFLSAGAMAVIMLWPLLEKYLLINHII